MMSFIGHLVGGEKRKGERGKLPAKEPNLFYIGISTFHFRLNLMFHLPPSLPPLFLRDLT
jgi:hypothetical protein